MWTPLLSLCLASASPTFAPLDAEVDGGTVFAWVLGETGVDSPRFARMLVLEELDAATIAERFAATPAGRRGLVSRELLRVLSEDPSDHVVVAGRITDHPGPWFDRGSAQASDDLVELAKSLAGASQAVDLLLLDGDQPISASKLDTADDLVWIAIRNDARFDEIRTPELTLEGAMTPANAQWDRWNDFADGVVSDAVERSTENLRKASPTMIVVCPPAGSGDATGTWTVDLGVRGGTIGFAANAFDEARGQIESAVNRRGDGTALMPRLLPFSHPGSSDARSFVTGTTMWDELVRHGILLGRGSVVLVDDRGTADPEDGLRLDAILKSASEQEWAKDLFVSESPDWSFRSGTGFFASGIGSADGDRVWRITFAPGFTNLTVDIDGAPTVVRREVGRTGGWLVHGGDVEPTFSAFASRGGDDVADPMRTGGGLVPADANVKGASFTTADSSATAAKPTLGFDPSSPDVLAGELGFTNQDLNGDGLVDGADQAIWLSGGAEAEWDDYGFGGDPYPDADARDPYAGEDLNGDGVVDGADLAIRLAGEGGFATEGSVASSPPNRVKRYGLDIRVKQPDLTTSDESADPSESGWTSTGLRDFDGNGVIDGVDLAMHLSSQGGIGSSDGEADGGPSADDEADSSGSDEEPTTDEPTEDTGTGSDDGGAPPSVDPTIPIGEGGDGDTAPPGPGSTLTVLYDGLPSDSIVAGLQADGVDSYIIVYEGVDPNARTTGQIDADKVVEHIRSKHGDAPSGYGILDFENPFFERMVAGPEDPHYQTTVDTLVALLQRVRAEFPNVKWTMYGMPRIKYWGPVGSYGWATATEPAREELLAEALQAFGPVLEHCDWLNPSVYDRYELERQNESSWPMWTDRETSWREYTVALCRRFNEEYEGPAKPIIPMVSPLFFKVGQIEYNMKYMTVEELLRDQVRPVMEAGADGVAFWTGLTYWTHAATSPDDLGVLQQESRVALANDFLQETPDLWVDDALRSDLRHRVSERVGESIQASRLEAQSILATRLAGVPDS